MLKNRNLSVVLITIFTLLFVNGDLHANKIKKIDDLLYETEKQMYIQDHVFTFDPKRWGIVEGIVSNEVAKKNTVILNSMIKKATESGVTIFQINEMDAYFDVATKTGSPRHDIESTIFIPSNFHLKMGNNCNLRVQPNDSERSVLLYSRSTENVTISGGKLWGDRYTHDYTTNGGTHDWGHIIMFRGVHNSVVDGVEMHEGVGDGIEIGGVEHRLDDGSIKPNGRESRNITVKNCLANDNRRINIGIVDGTDIFIEYNTIRNAGSGDNSSGVTSNGTSPRVGVHIESHKRNAPDNNSLYHWELVENIHIRNNVFENNYAADIGLYNGENMYVYENTLRSQRGVSAAYSHNNKIYNNTFERPEGLMSGSQAIILEPRYWANGTHRIIDFEVYDNNFTGYQYAIIAGGQGHEFKNNTIINCQRGITLIESIDLLFDNNTISSNVSRSYGYYTFTGGTSIKNCLIKNGSSSVQSRDLIFSNINNDGNGDVTIDNMNFNGGGIFLNSSQNITISNSTFPDLKLIDSSPTLINNN